MRLQVALLAFALVAAVSAGPDPEKDIGPCDVGEILVHKKCIGCHTADFYAYNQTVCLPYSICNETTQWISIDRTRTSDRVCSPLTICILGTSYETKRPSLRSNRACAPVTVCGAGFMQDIPPTLTTDRTCIPTGQSTHTTTTRTTTPSTMATSSTTPYPAMPCGSEGNVGDAVITENYCTIIFGNIDVESNTVPVLSTFHYNALTFITGFIVNSGGVFTQFLAPHLTYVTTVFDFHQDPALVTLDIHRLQFVGASFYIYENTALTSLLAPALTFIGSDMSIDKLNSLVSLDLSNLATVVGAVNIYTLGAPSISAPKLTFVGGNFMVVTNPSASTFNFAQLTYIAGDFSFYTNPSATALSLNNLGFVGGNQIIVCSNGNMLPMPSKLTSAITGKGKTACQLAMNSLACPVSGPCP